MGKRRVDPFLGPAGSVQRLVRDLEVAEPHWKGYPVYIEDEKVIGIQPFNTVVKKWAFQTTRGTAEAPLTLEQLSVLILTLPPEEWTAQCMHPHTDQRYNGLEVSERYGQIHVAFY